MLAQTVDAALQMKLVSLKHLETIIADTTEQPKAIAHPTDARLLELARCTLAKLAKAHRTPLKQTFPKEGKSLRFRAGLSHARQFKRMRQVVRRQSTIVRRLGTVIEARMTVQSEAIKAALGVPLEKAKRLVARARTRGDKRTRPAQGASVPKIYSWHAPSVPMSEDVGVSARTRSQQACPCDRGAHTCGYEHFPSLRLWIVTVMQSVWARCDRLEQGAGGGSKPTHPQSVARLPAPPLLA